MTLEDAENIEVQDKSLLYWAKKDPLRLEKLIENEFDDSTREAMIHVYRVHVLGHRYE